MDALADTVIGAHRPLVDLGSALVAFCPEFLFLLGSGLHDGGKFLFLSLEVLVADGKAVLQVIDIFLLFGDGGLRVPDSLEGDLAEKALVLDFLVYGIIFAAVRDVVQLLLVVELISTPSM